MIKKWIIFSFSVFKYRRGERLVTSSREQEFNCYRISSVRYTLAFLSQDLMAEERVNNHNILRKNSMEEKTRMSRSQLVSGCFAV